MSRAPPPEWPGATLKDGVWWRNDTDVTTCQSPTCKAPFTFTRRRHHCRICGDIFCSLCVNGNQIVRIPTAPEAARGKACIECFQKLADPPASASAEGGSAVSKRLALLKEATSRSILHARFSSTSQSLDSWRHRVYRRGFLTKQGGLVKNWKRRWCVLSDQGFQYYRDPAAQQAKRPLGGVPLIDILSIEDSDSVVEGEVPDQFRAARFVIVTKHRSYPVYADTPQEAEAWMRKMRQVIGNESAPARPKTKKLSPPHKPLPTPPPQAEQQTEPAPAPDEKPDLSRLKLTEYTIERLTPEERLVLSHEPKRLEELGMVSESIKRRATVNRCQELESEAKLVKEEEKLLQELETVEDNLQKSAQRMVAIQEQVTSGDESDDVDALFAEMEELGHKLESTLIPRHDELERLLVGVQDRINDIVIHRASLTVEQRLEVVDVEIARVRDREDTTRLVEMETLKKKLISAKHEHKDIERRQAQRSEAQKSRQTAFVSPLEDTTDYVRFRLKAMEVALLNQNPDELEAKQVLKWRAAKRHMEELEEEEAEEEESD